MRGNKSRAAVSGCGFSGSNRAWLAAKGKLTMPVYAIGGEKSFGPLMATVMRGGATNVTEGIVPASGHWIMEENPDATVKMVRAFLDRAN